MSYPEKCETTATSVETCRGLRECLEDKSSGQRTREREQLLLHVRDAEAEAKRAGERESELCGLLEELKGSAAEQQAEREQLRRELEREQRDRRNLRVELEIANEAAAKERSRVDEAWRQLAAAVAARDQARKDFEGLREQIALAQRERDEARARAALTSQQQATEEAMRRAEEARRELASIRSELLLP